MFKSSSDGKNLIVELVMSGDLFSLVSAVERHPVNIKIKAQVAATELLILPRKAFLLLLDKYSEMYKAFLEYATQRLRESYDFSKSLAHDQVSIRVACAIAKLIPYELRSEKSCHIEVTRREIADLTGTALETVVREIKKMEKNGILRLTRPKFIEVLDPDGLRKISEPSTA
jgi:CRP/FNR family transcriptional regulator